MEDQSAESTLFRKMEHVETEINNVRQNVGEILIRIDHLRTDHGEVKQMMVSLEGIMFGHNVSAGLMTRIEILEQTDKRRTLSERNKTSMFTGLWIAIALLVLDRVIGFVVGDFQP